MKNKILFLGGSSLLAHSWCNEIIDKDQVILGIHNRPSELDGFNTVSINFNNLENQLRELDIKTVCKLSSICPPEARRSNHNG